MSNDDMTLQAEIEKQLDILSAIDNEEKLGLEAILDDFLSWQGLDENERIDTIDTYITNVL